MDTIEFTVDDEAFVERLLERLKSIGNPTHTCRDKDGKKKSPRRAYRFDTAYYVRGQILYVCWSRIYRNVPHAVVEVHAGHFRSLTDFHEWLKFIFKDDYETVLDAPLVRLDLCVDICVPFDTVFESMYQPRIPKVTLINGTRKSIYLSAKSSDLRSIVYEKEVPAELIDYMPCDGKPFEKTNVVICTRIEARFYKKKVPISCLREANKLKSFNPFIHLKFRMIDEVAVRSNNDGKIPPMVLAFQQQCQKYGGHAARLEFNQGRNFTKIIGRYLGKLELDLQQAWLNRVARFWNDPAISSKKSILENENNKGV